MSAEAGLLRAILDDPDDDTPRLVYADWLDEHGDEARAEFIRLQVELAKRDADDERRPELKERAEQLRKAHGSKWLREVPAWVRSAAVFRRGFVAEVSATAAELLQDGEALFRESPVEALHLLGGARQEDLAELLRRPWLARVREFGLSLAELGTEAARLLAAAAHLRLRGLILKRTGLTAEGARELVRAPWLGGLLRLGLELNDVGDGGAEALANAPGLSSLRALDLSSNRLSRRGAEALAASPHLGNVQSLFLGHNAVRGPGAAALVASTRLPRLQVLLLWNCEVSAAAAERLASRPALARLTNLNLGGNPVSARGARALAASPHAANLRTLYLWDGGIGDEGAKALAASPHLANLTELNLRRAGVKTAGARALAQSPYLRRLRVLCLAGNTVSAPARRDLRERFGAALQL